MHNTPKFEGLSASFGSNLGKPVNYQSRTLNFNMSASQPQCTNKFQDFTKLRTDQSSMHVRSNDTNKLGGVSMLSKNSTYGIVSNMMGMSTKSNFARRSPILNMMAVQ